MSLVRALQLPPPPARVANADASEKPSAPGSGQKSAAPPAGGAAADGAAVLRAQAQAARAAIEARREAARTNLKAVEKLRPALEAKLKAAAPADKAAVKAQLDVVEAKSAEAVAAIEQAQDDLDTIDNPGAKSDALAAVLVRHDKRQRVEPVTEVQEIRRDGLAGKLNRDVTTSTSTVGDGKVLTQQVRDQREVGLDGVTTSRTETTEVRTADAVARRTEQDKTQVALDGTTTLTKQHTLEVETEDGKKATVDASHSQSFGKDGASSTKTAKVEKADGSAVEKSSTVGIETGDGKRGAMAKTATTTTSTSGTETARTKGASAGLTGDGKSVGGYAKADAGVKKTSKKGVSAGAVVGLHANVTCAVGDPKGDPPRWPLSLTVSFGGSAGGSAGKESKKHGTSVGVEAKASVEQSMVVEHWLGEAELQDYLGGLKLANAGKASAAYKEFQVIALGMKEDWGKARALWLGDVSKALPQRAGDSVTVSGSSGVSGGVDAKAKGVGVGYSGSETDTHSTKITRTDEGALDVEGEVGHDKKREKSASLSVGVASVKVGRSHEVKTSFGYSIVVDPKLDPDGGLAKALADCRTDDQYRMLLAMHPKALTLVSHTVGKEESTQTSVGVGVLGVELGISGGTSVGKKTKRDAKGKVVEQTVTGGSSSGGALGGLADSETEEAVAHRDKEGVSLTLKRQTDANYGKRARAKAEDKKIHDVSGLKLNGKELRRLGSIAVNSLPAWMGICYVPDQIADWKKAGQKAAAAKAEPGAVAEALALFVGGDRLRLETVERLARGGYNQRRTGKAFEFPDEISGVAEDYEAVTAESVEDDMNRLANKSGDAAASAACAKLLKKAQAVYQAINGCKTFRDASVQSEMTQRVQRRITQLEQAVRGFAGQKEPEKDPALLKKQAERLVAQCISFRNKEMGLYGKLDDLLDGETYFLARDKGAARKIVRQIEDLHSRWWDDYRAWKDLLRTPSGVSVDNPFIQPQEAVLKTYEDKLG